MVFAILFMQVYAGAPSVKQKIPGSWRMKCHLWIVPNIFTSWKLSGKFPIYHCMYDLNHCLCIMTLMVYVSALTAYTYMTIFDIFSLMTCLVTIWVEKQKPTPVFSLGWVLYNILFTIWSTKLILIHGSQRDNKGTKYEKWKNIYI